MTTTPIALVVTAHHRADSLTAHQAAIAAARLREAGYRVDALDLGGSGFDPRMTVADQPDWDDREKPYSAEVRAHQARVQAADVVVAVFPVYWYSVPALLKGWIDRVWNYGFAYGRSAPRLAGKRMLWLGLAGAAADDDGVALLRQALETQLRDGISLYCGFADAAVALLLEVEDKPQRIDAQGVLTFGDAREGGARQTHYAALERQTVEHVDKLIA